MSQRIVTAESSYLGSPIRLNLQSMFAKEEVTKQTIIATSPIRQRAEIGTSPIRFSSSPQEKKSQLKTVTSSSASPMKVNRLKND